MRSITLWVIILSIPFFVVDWRDTTDYNRRFEIQERILFLREGVDVEGITTIPRTKGMYKWMDLYRDTLTVIPPDENSSEEWKIAYFQLQARKKIYQR